MLCLFRFWFSVARQRTTRTVILALCLTAGANLEASATSCGPMEQRYFMVCDGQGCRTAFSVLWVEGFSRLCSARPVVADPDTQVSAFLGALVQAAHKPEVRGLFEIKLSTRYWARSTLESPDGFFESLKNSVHLDEQWKCSDIRLMPLSELIPQLKEQHGESWLVQRVEGTSAKEIAALRADFETEALQQQLIGIAGVSVNWLSSLLALLALIYSVPLYFSALYGASQPKRRAALLTPVAIQSAVGALGVGAALLYPFDFWPGTLLVPAALVILLTEAWAKLSLRHQAARAHEVA
jgi:hypothetical protein